MAHLLVWLKVGGRVLREKRRRAKGCNETRRHVRELNSKWVSGTLAQFLPQLTAFPSHRLWAWRLFGFFFLCRVARLFTEHIGAVVLRRVSFGILWALSLIHRNDVNSGSAVLCSSAAGHNPLHKVLSQRVVEWVRCSFDQMDQDEWNKIDRGSKWRLAVTFGTNRVTSWCAIKAACAKIDKIL